LQFSSFRERISNIDPFCNFLYKWTLGVGAVNCGAELTRLGATDHGAEVPRSHNHLANLASDVALGSAPWILAPRSAPPFSAPSPFYHRAKGAVNPFDRAARPPFTPPQISPPPLPPSSLPARAARHRPRSKAPGPGAVVVAPPRNQAPGWGAFLPGPALGPAHAAAAAVVRSRPPRLSPRPPSPASALPRNQAPGPRPARRAGGQRPAAAFRGVLPRPGRSRRRVGEARPAGG